MRFRMNKLSIIIWAALLPCFFVHAQKQESISKTSQDKVDSIANDINGVVKGKTNSAATINNSLLSPMNGQGQMSTFDGKQSFDGKAVCKGTSEFMKMLVQPGAGGDVTILNVMQDTNMDGKLDITMAPNWDVSAVCSNGFMTCTDPNNTTTCTSWAWTADSKSYQLGRKRVALTDLGGCYCINNKCGSNLAWTNMGQILRNLGGGASQALAAVNPWYTLSDVKIDGVIASFVGGDAGSCNVGDSTGFFNSPDGSQLLTYQNNETKMKDDAANSTQNSDAYKAIVNGSLNPNETSETRRCEVRRNVGIDEPTLDEIIKFDGGEGQVTQCGTDCLQLVLGRLGNDYWQGSCSYYEVKSNFILKDPSRIKSATLINAVFDDWMQVWVGDKVAWNGPYGNWTDAGPVPGACELVTSWNVNPNMDFAQYMKNPDPLQFKIRVEVSGAGEGYALLRVKTDMSCKLGAESISNTCTAYENDSTCKLVEEEIDGIKSFIGGINTGLKPLSQTLKINGNFCSIEVKRDWFTKKRVYRCNTKNDYDTYKIIERKGYIEDNVKPDHYKDKMFSENGKVTLGEGDLFWPKLPTVNECVNVCKTRKEKTTPDMSVSGQVDKNKVPGQKVYNYYYHECGTDNKCVTDSDEDVVKACQCINEFAEAAAIMQTMRQAGQDMICSSGEIKNPNGTPVE
ncbi:TPA: conjugal transfer protein TraN [Yersinia enterocolitica]|nr:conjugal transfer protein TraN [Yersinia enterocolitica]HDL6972066.1 conjugal transfer protein TraN [Yersinia enterocolitica]HDL6976009.1 conjugal transfer protein TraN [Yersinia enterocolitica]HDL6988408.1 conjugal transfer protein TraN [Yersinia enterocolitica]HDL6997077.1 conjugal transfer protein TraN [Yersinia enterocolitica]